MIKYRMYNNDLSQYYIPALHNAFSKLCPIFSQILLIDSLYMSQLYMR